MPSDNVIPLFPRRAGGWRRKALALAGASALALAPFTAVADPGASALPPGHPPVDTHRLPSGHPPVQGGDGACTPGLPPGHPSVQDPRLPEGHPAVELKPCAPGASGATSNGVLQQEQLMPSSDARLIDT